MIFLFIKIQFDIFSSKNFISWQRVMEEFNHEVSEIETEAKVFINQSFKKLRSSEGAFDMLLRFKNIRSREAINSEMMKKFTDILTQYVKECDLLFELFQKHKQLPPLYKNMPPISGAIAWSRFLFKSIKRPILKFLTIDELMSSEQGKEVTTDQIKYIFTY
jgi:dynein heavy chain